MVDTEPTPEQPEAIPEEDGQKPPLPDLTWKQVVFDFFFGALIPVVLLLVDPVVFRGDPCGSVGTGLPVSPGPFAPFVFAAVGPGVLAFVVWQFGGRRLPAVAGFFACVLLIGAVVAGGIGLLMLPLTIPGLFLIIGVLGLIPFITARSYWRNGVRALSSAREQVSQRGWLWLAATVLVGLILVVGIPAFFQWLVSRQVHQNVSLLVAHGDEAADPVTERLTALNDRCLGLCAPLIRQVFKAGLTRAPDHDALLEAVYTDITGQYLTCPAI